MDARASAFSSASSCRSRCRHSLVVAFFSFTLSWNEYLYAIVFNSAPSVLTIPTGLSNFVVEDVFFWGPIMASTVFTVIPPLVVYFFFQRWLITGLTMGAVKT